MEDKKRKRPENTTQTPERRQTRSSSARKDPVPVPQTHDEEEDEDSDGNSEELRSSKRRKRNTGTDLYYSVRKSTRSSAQKDKKNAPKKKATEIDKIMDPSFHAPNEPEEPVEVEDIAPQATQITDEIYNQINAIPAQWVVAKKIELRQRKEEIVVDRWPITHIAATGYAVAQDPNDAKRKVKLYFSKGSEIEAHLYRFPWNKLLPREANQRPSEASLLFNYSMTTSEQMVKSFGGKNAFNKRLVAIVELQFAPERFEFMINNGIQVRKNFPLEVFKAHRCPYRCHTWIAFSPWSPSKAQVL